MAITAANKHKEEYYGLSNDTKPTEGVPVGSTFWETDTKTGYVYIGSVWCAVS